jgi:hypothetical protein
MMLVTDIILPADIETDTDAYRVLRNENARDMYLAEFENAEVIYDVKYDVYRVPSLKAKIAEYTKAKAADCAVWGCE